MPASGSPVARGTSPGAVIGAAGAASRASDVSMLVVPERSTAARPASTIESSTNKVARTAVARVRKARSEEHTSELQSLMRISSDVFCLKKQKNKSGHQYTL